MDAAGVREVLDAALELARGAIAGIRNGDVPARPIGGSCPDWCGLEGICRVRTPVIDAHVEADDMELIR